MQFDFLFTSFIRRLPCCDADSQTFVPKIIARSRSTAGGKLFFFCFFFLLSYWRVTGVHSPFFRSRPFSPLDAPRTNPYLGLSSLSEVKWSCISIIKASRIKINNSLCLGSVWKMSESPAAHTTDGHQVNNFGRVGSSRSSKFRPGSPFLLA